MSIESAPAEVVAVEPESVVLPPSVTGHHDFFDEAEPEQKPAEKVVAPDSPTKPSPPTPPPAPVKQVHKHPRWLERAAIEQGMKDEDIESTPSEVLNQKVYEAQQRVIADARRGSASSDANQLVRQPKPQPVPEVPAEEEDLTLNADDWDPAFVQKWNKQQEKTKAIEKELAELRAIKGQVQASATASLEQKIDGLFAGSSMDHIFGAGSVRALEPNGAEYLRRSAVLREMHAIATSGRSQGIDADFQKVVTAMFGPIAPKAQPEPKADASREEIKEAFRNGGLNRPTQRNNTPLPKGRQAAISAVESWKKDNSNGADTGVTHDDDPADGLPD